MTNINYGDAARWVWNGYPLNDQPNPGALHPAHASAIMGVLNVMEKGVEPSLVNIAANCGHPPSTTRNYLHALRLSGHLVMAQRANAQLFSLSELSLDAIRRFAARKHAA